jgi:type I restriction enzyme S subunit
MRILAPANELAEHFGQVVRPWFAKIEANKTESRTLATLRDTLLPKLISGALRVKDVEHFLGSED